MKHFFPAFGLLLTLAASTLAAPLRPAASVTTLASFTATVYVCLSLGSVAYHGSDGCSGLNRCTHPLKAMPTEEAEKLGKRACCRCY